MRHQLVVGVFALCAAGTLSAQAPAVAPPSGILGFLAVAWGAKGAEITSAYGPPMMDQPTADSGRVLIYKDQVLGKSVLALFYLDRAKGLVKGVYSVPYDRGTTDCDVVFDKFKVFVQRMYPTLTPVEARKHEDPVIPFCDAAEAGKASRSAVWTDASSRNSVHVTLEADEQHVDVAFESRDFKAVAGN